MKLLSPKRLALLFACALCLNPAIAADNTALQQEQLENLRREVEALKSIRMQKADRLEQIEAQRWQERYEQNKFAEDYQDESRALEGRYSKAASDLSRLSDETSNSRNLATDLEEKSKAAEASLGNLNVQIKQTVEKSASDLAADFPVGVEQRTLALARADAMLEKDNAQIGDVINLFFEDQQKRLQLTQSQNFEFRESQMDKRTDVQVYRLRLGTIFLAEVEREATGQAQALLRTGALQGQVFEWRTDLASSFETGVRDATQAVQKEEKSVWVPLDVLQTKAIKNTTAAAQEQGWRAKLMEWFKAGGIVMYPLLLVALFGFFMAVERGIVFRRRGHVSKKFISNLHKLVAQKNFVEAHILCKKQKTSLGNVMLAIVEQAHSSRAAAEKSLHEAMLREQPVLETRMGLIAAMGMVAPLLGLLGTVTGMITLFNVITDVGTNDARILAGGISEALVTTETGLIIAIPILLFHGKLSENLDYITGELGIQSFALLNRIFPEEERAAA